MEIDEIISGCQNGSKKHQEALVRRFAPGLLAICRRYTRDSETAHDALQEAFINIFKYVNGFKGKGSFEGWLKRIAVNCAITFQKKHFKVYFEPDVLHDSSQHAEIPDVYSRLGQEEIMALLKELPPALYTVFNMHVVEGYDHREISEMLGVSEGTSRAALSRARAKLIDIIKERRQQEDQRIHRLSLI